MPLIRNFAALLIDYAEAFADTTDERENFTANPPDLVIIDSFGEMFEKAVSNKCNW